MVELCSQNELDNVVYGMYALVMMYVHEMLSEYVRVWENKSLTVARDL